MEVINDPNVENKQPQLEVDEKVENLIGTGFSVNIGNYVNKGFEIFKKDIGGFLGFTVLFIAISVVLGFIPIIGTIGSIIITPALSVGFFVVARKIDKGESYSFNNFFDGFQKTLPLFLGQLVAGILVAIGAVLLLIPGIYLAVGYTLVSLFIWFGNKDFWDAMELSRKLVTKKWFAFFGFAIVLGLINLAGIIALGVGIFVTIPATVIAMYAAYDDIVGIDD